MLTWEDDLEVHALRRRGWTISAIARHTGLDRKTVRKYLAGDGKPGTGKIHLSVGLARAAAHAGGPASFDRGAVAAGGQISSGGEVGAVAPPCASTPARLCS